MVQALVNYFRGLGPLPNRAALERYRLFYRFGVPTSATFGEWLNVLRNEFAPLLEAA